MVSNTWRRLTPSRRMGTLFMRATASAMAALASWSEKKVRWRRRPRM